MNPLDSLNLNTNPCVLAFCLSKSVGVAEGTDFSKMICKIWLNLLVLTWISLSLNAGGHLWVLPTQHPGPLLITAPWWCSESVPLLLDAYSLGFRHGPQTSPSCYSPTSPQWKGRPVTHTWLIILSFFGICILSREPRIRGNGWQCFIRLQGLKEAGP